MREVDRSDESRLHEWYSTWATSVSHRPPELVTSWEIARVGLARQHPEFRVVLLTAYDGEVPVGAGLVNLPMADNPELAYAEVTAHPDHRGHGVGSAVLAEVEARSRAAGRGRVLVEVHLPPPGIESAGTRFAQARGYSLANREETKALDAVASEPTWAGLEREVAHATGGYQVVAWRTECPEDLVASYGAALSRVMSLIPQGDLDIGDRDWTVDRVRAHERHQVEIGVIPLEAAAVAPDGSVVGLTGLQVSTHDPRVAHVGVTMVLPEHRGHRLGLAMKLATHRALRADFPECRLVVTSNADVNEHMNAVNQALGYRVVEHLLEYHRSI
ncbi:MAG TPA: GNAT family N-acetyltransferase [Nocardioides sp.]|uniref:GNAT family N-acetyltransferase n=1 Tax=Nocardioides sp. TaxID=35761 RepID=UPI002F3F3E5D